MAKPLIKSTTFLSSATQIGITLAVLIGELIQSNEIAIVKALQGILPSWLDPSATLIVGAVIAFLLNIRGRLKAGGVKGLFKS